MVTKEQIIEEISKYGKHSEKLVLATLMAINQRIHVLNISEAGHGKSHCTEELLNLLKIPHNLVAGHISPKAFFDILKKDGIIVVDEGATILSDKTIQNLLLNALWNGKVEWMNNREEYSHNFKGIVIFNSNVIENTPIMKALSDRIFTNKITLSSDEMKEKILSTKNYEPNMEVWAEIKERLLEEKTDISDTIRERLYTLIQNSDSVKSMREMYKLKKIASFSLSLVGDLSLIDYFRETDEVWKIMNMHTKRSEKVKMIAEQKCITERHARRMVAEMEG